MPDTSIYSPSSFRKFLEILKRGGNLKASSPTWFCVEPDLREKVYEALEESGGHVLLEGGMPAGTLLAHLSSWNDASEVVLRLPEAQNVDSYPETRSDGATRRESTEKVPSSEPPTTETEPWDVLRDPLGPRQSPKSPKN